MLLVGLATLSACVEATAPGQPSDSGLSADEARARVLGPAPAGTDPALARAPEVFRASGVAVWNGMRTVRGLWVAHPAATRSRQVRVVNPATGAEIDAMLYRPERTGDSDIVTVSSDAAEALGLEPGEPATLALFGLRPRAATSAHQRRAIEASALSELASHLAGLERNELVQLVAAAMRGMGYATAFEPAAAQGELPEIHVFPRPNEGLQLPSIRVLVRPAEVAPMTARELAARQALLTKSGDLGLVVSVPGFVDDAVAGLDPAGARIEMMNVEGLLDIWLTYYEALSEADRALLRLEPVWFLAAD